MANLFNTQSLLDLVLDTNIDLSSATSKFIHYEKPSGTDGSWTGVLEGTTSIRYSVQPGDIDEVGTWRFQTVVVIGGRTGYGDIVKLKFKERITTL